MARGARYAFVALAWAFLAGLVVQVFFIGLGLFADAGGIELHRNFGYVMQLAPILVLAAAALSRAGRPLLLQVLALTVTVFVFPILPALRDALPALAALHPVGALLAFWLAIVVARGATLLVRRTEEDAGAAGASAR